MDWTMCWADLKHLTNDHLLRNDTYLIKGKKIACPEGRRSESQLNHTYKIMALMKNFQIFLCSENVVLVDQTFH